MGDNNLYTGAEAGTVWNGSSPEPDTLFLIHPPGVPLSAVPIFDEENHAIIGFRHGSGGVYRIYDLCGNLSGMEEEPLQTPLFDPIDLIFLGYGLLRGIGRAGAQHAVRKLSGVGIRGTVVAFGRGTVMTLRASYRQLLLGELKFATEAAAHMGEAGRYVPVHILRLAIKFGKRAPDPQRAVGAFEYTIPMFRQVLRSGKPVNVEYTLKVVIREADSTIFHFHYFR